MIFHIPSSIAWQAYYNSVYIFDDVNRTSFVLKDVAYDIWMQLVKVNSLNSVIDFICLRYPNVDKDIIVNDINCLIKDFQKNKIMEIIYGD